MGELLFLFLNIFLTNPSLDYQVNMDLDKNKYGEKYYFQDNFYVGSTTTFHNPTLPNSDSVRWGMALMFEQKIYKDYIYYRAYSKYLLSDKKKIV